MKLTMKIVSQILLAYTLVLLFSCSKSETKDTADLPGKIYYRWSQRVSGVPNNTYCGIAGNYSDNNPVVPNNAIPEMYYGPCEAGTYQGQYFLDVNISQSVINFPYTLEKPADGYKRYYTNILKEYNPSVNRCLDYSRYPGYFTYNDEKQ